VSDSSSVVQLTAAPFDVTVPVDTPLITGAWLSTVTVTAADVDTFPAASRATAVNACVPLDDPTLFQLTPYGELVSSNPKFTPSSLNCTPTTPTLSVAVALTATALDTVTPFDGPVNDTTGACVSGGAGVVST
jgi:hypothetical protein